MRLNIRMALLAAAAMLGGTAFAAAPGLGPAASYQELVTTAMDRMMKGMMVAPSGNVDRDFVAMMTPHHQGAIDMAVAELRYGKNEQLKRIAQEIIVDQQQEIAAMKYAVGEPLPPDTPVPTGTQHMKMER